VIASEWQHLAVYGVVLAAAQLATGQVGTIRSKKRRDWLKQQAQRHPDWLLVEEDECWLSRFAQPQAHAWAGRGGAPAFRAA
jgi:hypothetical protein